MKVLAYEQAVCNSFSWLKPESALLYLQNLQIVVNQHSPNLDQFKITGQDLLQDLQPESKGHEQVKKQIEDFENCWRKLEKDIEDKIEKVRMISWSGLVDLV